MEKVKNLDLCHYSISYLGRQHTIYISCVCIVVKYFKNLTGLNGILLKCKFLLYRARIFLIYF